MSADTYQTIASSSDGLFKDRGSKFIALAFPVVSEDDIKDILKELRKKYHDARHHCYAYRLGADMTIFRANDDGEPSNSAGKPILGQIQSKNLTDVLIVVIRYFGGTLLGVGGLINAYRSAAADALGKTEIVTRNVLLRYDVTFDYIAMNDVMKIIKDENIGQLETRFDVSCFIKLAVRKKDAERIEEKFKNLKNVNLKQIS